MKTTPPNRNKIPAARNMLLALAAVAVAFPAHARSSAPSDDSASRYAGLWVTADGQIRHQLLPNGRYVEARGTRERAYEGRFEVTGSYIRYWDDTGFTADGDFIDGVLHHGGMILYRQ